MTSEIKEKIFKNDYYVYELIDPETNIVFYVGKGKRYRCFLHEYQTKNGNIPHNNKHLFHKINQILHKNLKIKYNIVFSSNDEDECYKIEEQLIFKYGIDNLCNIELCHKGFKHTDETKRKISISNTGKICSEETKEKLRIINTGKHLSNETKQKISKIHKGKKHKFKTILTDETKQKMSDSHKGKKHTKESIEKMKIVQKGKIISIEQREKIRKKLTMERIEITQICENCGTSFTRIIKKYGKNKIKKCCSRRCASKMSNNAKIKL